MSVHSLELSVRTMLFTKPIAGLDDFVDYPDDVLVDVVEQPEQAAKVWKARRESQPGWSEGALLIGYGGRPLIDLTMWDSVWPLWSYLVTMIEEYLDSSGDELGEGRGEFSFPMQPLDAALYDSDQTTWFLVGDNHVDVHRDSFIDQVLTHAHEFFEWVAEWTEDDAAYELEQVAGLIARRQAE
ncbi:hypothetical protein [Lysinibacter cavernae]|uniref:Uncharacterized protein n=1 Tax=Lysinibacter cavernae TaxID=1640652 RepID=A0A7X5R2F9_9MICO|nr:hypothetical protein [Lysinibacter cavernae]NIH54326.1 hypothetical protein [Lysinibacter cavernae]